MIVIDPGHKFLLHALDGPCDVRLTFVKREGEKFPGNVGSYSGTILQECWRAEISRIKYLNCQIPSPFNLRCIDNLRECIYFLEQRAAMRHNATYALPYLDGIEDIPICKKCGHIFPHDHGDDK